MKVFAVTLLLAVAARANPALVYGGLPYAAGLGHLGYPYAVPHVVPATHEVTYKTVTPTVETNVVATNLPVPVAVGGYKAVAGDNGDLKGAVHEVPALFGAPALNSQVNDASQGSLTVGTSAVITHTAGEPIVNEHTVTVPTYGLYGGHYYGKREAEETAAAPVVYAGYPFAAGYPYAGLGHLGYPYAVPHVVPATHEVTYKTVTPTVETNVVATNAAVPVAVGGYKAVAGDNGELKGAVHEVPAIFGAPALNAQVNDASQGSLTVGTSAVITHTLGEPIVNEHTAVVPTLAYYGKRSADAEPEAKADPYLLYGGYGLGYRGYGYGGYYGHGLGYGGYYYGKRSADAEPEAKADPYLLYGGYYGHGLGYGYGYGYPYGAGYAYYG